MDKYRKIKDTKPFFEGGSSIQKSQKPNAVRKGMDIGIKHSVNEQMDTQVTIDELKKFKDYSDNLTLSNHIFTKLAVVSAIISYKSDIMVAIVSDTTEHFEILAYRFKDNQEEFRI